MKITFDLTKFQENLKRIETSLHTEKKVRVGVFDTSGENLAAIASAHEFGATIVPKNVKWLTIPIIKGLKGKSARDFDLEFIPRNGKIPILAKVDNGKVTPYYLLRKKVEIPKRSFIKSTIEDKSKVDNVFRVAVKLLPDVIAGKKPIENFLEGLGSNMAAEIKKTINDGLIEPPNSALTKALKGSSKPLYHEGRLINAIHHIIE